MQTAMQANKNVYLLDTLRVQDTHVPSANSLFSVRHGNSRYALPLNISFNYKGF